MTDFDIYTKNNSEFIPNFGDRWRQGERISTAFVESTINQLLGALVSKSQKRSDHNTALQTPYMLRNLLTASPQLPKITLPND